MVTLYTKQVQKVQLVINSLLKGTKPVINVPVSILRLLVSDMAANLASEHIHSATVLLIKMA